MKQVSLLIKPASSSCNLRCSYCFYCDETKLREKANYGILPIKQAELIIKKSFEYIDEDGKVLFSFQGGEPTIAGLDWFKQFVSLVKIYKGNKQVNYAIQTNGTLLNEEWADFLKTNNFLVGISLDGYQTNNDIFRFDSNNKSVYYKIVNNIDMLKKAKVDFNILTVLTSKLAQKPKALFNFYKENHFQFIQLIPCLPSMNSDSIMDKYALTPKQYSSFFKEFFDLWYKDTLNGGNMDINLFSNIMAMLQGEMPYQCGMIGKCAPQYVIEGDGSIYPCDFFVLDKYQMGNINQDDFKSLAASNIAQDFINTPAKQNAICSSCQFLKVCHGGCKRQNACYLQEDYCGYKDVLEHIIGPLSRLL